MNLEARSIPTVVDLIGSLPTASAICDPDLRYLAVNDAWRTSYGLGDVDLVGQSHLECVPSLVELSEADYRRALDGEPASGSGTPHRRADGSDEYVDWTMSPWHDERGDVAGIVLHTEIVTDREVMRRGLEEQRSFLRAFVDESPIGLNLCRLDGVWVESNPAFLEIIGYSREEADGGLSYWELTPREYDDAEQEQLRQLERTGRYGPYEKEFVRKDGLRVPVRLNGFLIERDGERYIWSLIEDISHQRELEADLEAERAKTLQTARLASIGEMAAGVAHEINNPLQIIEGFSFLLKRAIESGQQPPAEAIDKIRHATDRAARIVSYMRKFAREPSTDAEDHSVAEIVDETLSLTGERIRNHGVRLDTDVRSNRTIHCSALELTQVLVNLLHNAFDAVRASRGSILLEVFDDANDEVVFSVRDSGPGVPDGIVDRLFQPFVTSKETGTGLGLSISQGIVAALGGSLTYRRDDDGTRFEARIPRAGDA
ncbi:MAG: PAS domain S-box protein [Planctomycetes bacterium]|nr:PAS domain S-box protein [Planctomycetota bacterium]